MLGVGWSRHHRFGALSHFELRSESSNVPIHRLPAAAGLDDGNGLFKLALVGRDGDDVIEFGPFTQAEARWIADELFHDFRAWLVKVGD
jgi:hypothetical protein